jgi:Putative peptidoglycan binding domain
MQRSENNMVMVRIIICLIGILLFGACSANDPQGALPTNMMSTTDTATIQAVQSALRQRHYYHGQVDGFFGQATAVAIERVQIDHDLYVNGAIDRSLLLALGITKH